MLNSYFSNMANIIFQNNSCFLLTSGIIYFLIKAQSFELHCYVRVLHNFSCFILFPPPLNFDDSSCDCSFMTHKNNNVIPNFFFKFYFLKEFLLEF